MVILPKSQVISFAFLSVINGNPVIFLIYFSNQAREAVVVEVKERADKLLQRNITRAHRAAEAGIGSVRGRAIAVLAKLAEQDAAFRRKIEEDPSIVDIQASTAAPFPPPCPSLHRQQGGSSSS